jgi:hypothetical protein
VAYAVVIQVKFAEDGDREEGLRMLNERVVPNAKSQPGFQRGSWLWDNGTNGMGVVVFDTEDNATAAQENLKLPPGGPQLVSLAVYEVSAEA